MPSRVQVFVSYDAEHDGDLYERLLGQSKTPDSAFDILGGSERGEPEDRASAAVRDWIRDAEQVIFLCGAHTGDSPRVHAELRLVQEQRTPYLLLWGRRETMCTKPVGAKSSEAMYSWTSEILRDQIVSADRKARADAAARSAIAAKRELARDAAGEAETS